MRHGWQFFTEPPLQWTRLCQKHKSLFHTPAWQSLLTRSFGAFPLFALGTDGNDAFALTVFPVGPFRVGYAGFPAGGLVGARQFTTASVTQLVSAAFPRTVHLLRLVATPFPEPLLLDYPHEETWETTVPNLSSWQEEQLAANVRRNLRKAKKNNVLIKKAELCDAQHLFRLYWETIRRHGGFRRYSLLYFHQLLELAQETPNLQCWLAVLDKEVIGFIILAREGDTAYYLHGAVSHVYQQYRPGDLAFNSSIHWAKEEGASQFNMMSSPLNQPSLVRYKEKWGGVTCKQRTYDLPLRPAAAHLFRWLAKGYNLISGNIFRRLT
jgi:hypothetical protein